MSRRNSRSTLLLASLVVAISAIAPRSQAETKHCSTARAAGGWAYTYTGSIVTPNALLPAAAVGHYTTYADGTLAGSQTRTVAGTSGNEDIVGTLTVNADCTGTATIGVYVNNQLQRTTVLAVAYDSNMNHARAIFESVVLPDNTKIPVVITSDNARVFPKD